MKIGQTFIMNPESKYSRLEYKIISIRGEEVLANPTGGQNHHVYGFKKEQVKLALGE